MLIFAISFFLSSCFVHLFTFLSLFLHSREQWLKCAYIYYSFVVFIPNNSEQILFAYYKNQLYSRGWWQEGYKCVCKNDFFKFLQVVEFNHRRLLVQISFWTWSSIKILHILLIVQTREYFALEGSYWGVKIVTDIFGIGNIVPIWTFSWYLN